MRKGDLYSVNRVLSSAFTQAVVEEGRGTKIPLCEPRFLEMYLAGEPEGCFVTEEEGQIVGFAFSRLWGKVGWIGPLAVSPSKQNKGYGREITLRCVEHLKMRGATTIGLETSAHSHRNLGFYTKLGFVVEELSVDLVKDVLAGAGKELGPGIQPQFYSKLEEGGKDRFIAEQRQLSHVVDVDLDYSREINLIDRYEFGNSCLIKKGDQNRAFCLVHTEKYSAEEQLHVLRVVAMQLHPSWSNRDLKNVVEILNWLARQRSLDQVYVRVPTRYDRAFRYLLSCGFRVRNTDLRMTYQGYSQSAASEGVNLNRWQ